MVGLITQRLRVPVSGQAGIVAGGSECSTLSTLNTMTEVRPLSKAPNPQLLPGRHSIGCPLLRVCVRGVCMFTAVCVCTLDGLNAEHKFRVWVTILGHMSRHFFKVTTKQPAADNELIIAYV